ncbi:helix-turn-helix transcriptional regulator [Nocardia asteroides]|uniref:helix-turn-helix transcriptional regulator n=1 Tax=Nocardia asteroides TaxID=1824 RepID=UPI001E3A94AE|nr:helix-turn-helix transcriptional regulator [Nocardia asteroides]UGT61596.1 helix-turn-helix domain-containing protein [Nocardia asteroides]
MGIRGADAGSVARRTLADAAGVLLETDDVALAELELSRLGTPLRLGATTSQLPIGVRHREIGPIGYSSIRIGGDLGYDAEPSGCWTVLVLRTGVLEPRFSDADGPRRVTPGQVLAMELPEQPAAGVIRHASWQQVRLRPETLARAGERGGRPPRLGGHDPVSRAAAARLTAVIEHIGADAEFLSGSAPLAGAAADYLAAVVLESFPRPGSGGPPEVGTHPETVRRAVAYMESHARDDISLADVAAAAFVSIRGVQLAFRRHLNTTPVHHLRRIRLARAHAELVAADPDSGCTVGAIAAGWGFSNPGRFAIAYRHVYGCTPSTTLNR